MIEVRDRGMGMASEDAARLFEPFSARIEVVCGSRGGYRLGLALARRSVDAHSGTLRLLPRPGGGTVARIELPINVTI